MSRSLAGIRLALRESAAPDWVKLENDRLWEQMAAIRRALDDRRLWREAALVDQAMCGVASQLGLAVTPDPVLPGDENSPEAQLVLCPTATTG